MRRTVTGLVLVGLVGAVVFAAWRVLGGPALKTEAESAPAMLLFPQGPTDGLLWPQNHTWLWSVSWPDAPGKGDSLSLVVRAIHRPVDNDPPVVGPARKIARAESKAVISPGKLLGVKGAGSATVCVQLLDLAEAGLKTGAEKKPFRLLLTLRKGGATIYRKGPESAIEGDELLGSAMHQPEWVGGELHLLNLFVREGNQVTTYDIVIVRGE